MWAQADAQVMADAAVFPITSPTSANYHAAQVHNAVFVPQLFQFDPTNVWLTPAPTGADRVLVAPRAPWPGRRRTMGG